MEVFPGVSVDAGVRFGKPCIAGTRTDVATVVAALDTIRYSSCPVRVTVTSDSYVPRALSIPV